jgi:hypothetical protein
MTSAELDNLLRIGKLKREPPSARERRNLAEGEGLLEHDERLTTDVLAAARRVLAAIEALPESGGAG